MQAHDAQIAASGITTVFDALRVGLDEDAELTGEEMRMLANTIEAAKEQAGFAPIISSICAAKCRHPTASTASACYRITRWSGWASLMDHAPGQRQFASLESYKHCYQGKLKMSDAQLAEFSARRNNDSERYSNIHRLAIAAQCHHRSIVLASHDDATPAHVDEAIAQGIQVAAFPTTIDAAEASHKAGMAVLMGAPNVVRGASHSGNVSARELAEAGVLDILSSDHVPFSLIQATFALSRSVPQIELPEAVRMVSKTPAEAAGLDDRGEIATGRRADLVRVHLDGDVPVVRSVWREGRRVI